MDELRRFASTTALQLPEEALINEQPQAFLNEHHSHPVQEIQPIASLVELDTLIEEITGAFQAGDTAIDAALCVPLHQALPLTRRIASDRRMWGWLGAMRYADFVAHRWRPGPSGARQMERFTGNRVRQALARLWWAAELTWSSDTGYEWTERLLALSGFQDLYEAMAGRAFCAYQPAVRAFIARVGPKPESTIRETAKEFSYVLTTMVLEAMSEQEISDLLDGIVEGQATGV